MPTTETTQQIIHAFNTNNKAEISSFTTKQLEDTIVDLGSINKSDRTAIQFEIERRNKSEERQYNSYVRALGYIVALAIAFLAGYYFAKS